MSFAKKKAQKLFQKVSKEFNLNSLFLANGGGHTDGRTLRRKYLELMQSADEKFPTGSSNAAWIQTAQRIRDEQKLYLLEAKKQKSTEAKQMRNTLSEIDRRISDAGRKGQSTKQAAMGRDPTKTTPSSSRKRKSKSGITGDD